MRLAAPIVEQHCGYNVIRDDKLQGGSKRRALVRWLAELDHDHFSYAGTVFGSGAWALAEACYDLGKHCTIYMARGKYQPIWLGRMNRLPCRIIWTDPLPVLEIEKQAVQNTEAHYLPIGFDHADFIRHMSAVFQKSLPHPEQIWLPNVGGTLLKAAIEAWPKADIRAVCAARLTEKLEGITCYQAPEKYHQPARMPPPYPACPFSDGKLWQFARQFAVTNAYIWNTSI